MNLQLATPYLLRTLLRPRRSLLPQFQPNQNAFRISGRLLWLALRSRFAVASQVCNSRPANSGARRSMRCAHREISAFAAVRYHLESHRHHPAHFGKVSLILIIVDLDEVGIPL
jgi:hypothetical protein